jgi:hypothetical protein
VPSARAIEQVDEVDRKGKKRKRCEHQTYAGQKLA